MGTFKSHHTHPLKKLALGYIILALALVLPVLMKNLVTGAIGPTSIYFWSLIWLPVTYLAAGWLLSRAHFIAHFLMVGIAAYFIWMSYPIEPNMDPIRQTSHQIFFYFQRLVVWAMLADVMLTLRQIKNKSLPTAAI
jgi:hypothetical protein